MTLKRFFLSTKKSQHQMMLAFFMKNIRLYYASNGSIDTNDLLSLFF
ncbi:hypothetical protein FLBR109950_06135 [Flavobacterium branchiophilum]